MADVVDATPAAAEQHTYKFDIAMSCGGCSGAVDRVLKKLDGLSPPLLLQLYVITNANPHRQASRSTKSPSKSRPPSSRPSRRFPTTRSSGRLPRRARRSIRARPTALSRALRSRTSRWDGILKRVRVMGDCVACCSRARFLVFITWDFMGGGLW